MPVVVVVKLVRSAAWLLHYTLTLTGTVTGWLGFGEFPSFCHYSVVLNLHSTKLIRDFMVEYRAAPQTENDNAETNSLPVCDPSLSSRWMAAASGRVDTLVPSIVRVKLLWQRQTENISKL